MELILSFVCDKKKIDHELDVDDLITIDNKFEDLNEKITISNYKHFIDIYKNTNFEEKNQWQFILQNLTENNEEFRDFYNNFYKEYDIDFSRVIFFETYKHIIDIIIKN